MSSWSEKEIMEANEKIMKRAARDPEFRSLALKDANGAVKQATGRNIPGDFKLRFVDNQGADATVVLPDPTDPKSSLSDSDLEQVAGGGRCGGSCVGISECVISG